MSAHTPDHPAPYRPMCSPEQQTSDPMLIQALAGLSANDERYTAQTARRRVAGKILSTQGQKKKKRDTLGIAILASLGILVLLSPAIWQSVENYLADGHFGDMGSQVTLLILLLVTALLAALIAGCRSRQEVRHAKRNI